MSIQYSNKGSPEEVDIGVETAETHRHHGLASYLAYKMCEEIMRQGRRPVWAHAETNTGSQKTALSAGFKPIGINTVIQKKKYI
jgi:predicted GNAT family acetyltransferase